MSVNPASNFPNLAQLSTSVLANNASGVIVDSAIQTFLTGINSDNYGPMVVALNAALAALAVGSNDSLRILLAIDDGTVAYDSSKITAGPGNTDLNTYTNFSNNVINSSNHNTRPEIMVAILGNSGVGISNRFSKSVSTFQKYQATRLGVSTQANLGTFRVSLNDTN